MDLKKSPTHLARDLRRRQTKEEILLWAELRNRKLDGFKFLRQYPICINEVQSVKEFIIADFYCVVQKLIIEVDGGYHKAIEARDANRDNTLLELLGIRTLRIKNQELENLNVALDKIRSACK